MTFGKILLRLHHGYRQSRYGWVRVSFVARGWRIDVIGEDDFVKADGAFVPWWDSRTAERFLDQLLFNLFDKNYGTPRTFFVDDDGNKM